MGWTIYEANSPNIFVSRNLAAATVVGSPSAEPPMKTFSVMGVEISSSGGAFTWSLLFVDFRLAP